MIKPDPPTLARIINNSLMNLRLEGFTSDDDLTPETHLGFSASEVEGVHTHKEGVGDGAWFRLKDGRVIDSYGEPSDSDQRLYDTVPN